MSDKLEGRLIRADAIVTPAGFERDVAVVEDDMLRKSIELHGIQQPLVVLALPDGRYSLIDGFRRLEIARGLDITTVPAIVNQLPSGEEAGDYQDYIRFILDEHRQDLRASQFAKLVQHLLDTVKIPEKDDTGRIKWRPIRQKEIAAMIGVDAGTMTNKLAINQYVPEIVTAIDTGEVTLHAARAFDGLRPEAQSRIFKAHRKEMATTAGDAFHRMVRTRYSPAKYPDYYVSPEKTQEKLRRAEKGRKSKRRPRVDETKRVLESLQIQAVQLEDAQKELKHKSRCCTLAGPIANAILRSEKIMAEFLADGKAAEKEELEVFVEYF